MSTVVPTAPATIELAAEAASPAPRVLTRLAGAALPAGAVLFAAGILSSPIATGDDRAGYLESLGRDPGLTQLSAVLLHYGTCSSASAPWRCRCWSAAAAGGCRH